ncbi:hypothetical protein [Streptomyces sp. NBRC 109706]|uniref:hypothetical protein n=1 Tax=Streptomyces sp. NBRC 109706 TaxID=1550035 RepID=UPI00131BA9BF|nr:hypothetical protein [Streptomyces sp. NBRC 109706]
MSDGGWVGIVIAVLALAGTAFTARQSRAAQRESARVPTFEAITSRLDSELRAEQVQRRLLTSYVLDLLRWARRVEPDSKAGPPPEPPDDLDLTPWR